MEWLKALFALVTSFLQNSTAKQVEEVKLADATEKAVVESIRASSNALAVEQTTKIINTVNNIEQVQDKKRAQEKKKPLSVQLDNQFGSDS